MTFNLKKTFVRVIFTLKFTRFLDIFFGWKIFKTFPSDISYVRLTEKFIQVRQLLDNKIIRF